MQISFLSASLFLLSQGESLKTRDRAPHSGCVGESVAKRYERLFTLPGDAFPGGKEEGWIQVRGCAWFASLRLGITPKESIIQKNPIKGQTCWVIAQRC